MNWIKIRGIYIRTSDIASVESYDTFDGFYCIEIGIKGIGKRTFEYKSEAARDSDLKVVFGKVIGDSVWT